jgi:hypothetical protein
MRKKDIIKALKFAGYITLILLIGACSKQSFVSEVNNKSMPNAEDATKSMRTTKYIITTKQVLGEQTDSAEEMDSDDLVSFYVDILEDTILRSVFFDNANPIKSDKKGIKKTDFYSSDEDDYIYFITEDKDQVYSLYKLVGSSRYGIDQEYNSMNFPFITIDQYLVKHNMHWIGNAEVNYDANGIIEVPELTEEDEKVLEVLRWELYQGFLERQGEFQYQIYLGDISWGMDEGKEAVSIYLALIGESNFFVWAEITKEAYNQYDIWMYPSPFGLPMDLGGILYQDRGIYDEVTNNIVSLNVKIGEIKNKNN